MTHVLEGTPAHGAGVNVGDEILAVDGQKATIASVGTRSSRATAGDELRLVLLRRDRLLEVVARMQAPVRRRARILPMDDADAPAIHVRKGWLEVATPSNG